MEKTFVIRKLIPELSADYFDFFDHLAFSDSSPMQPCYCCNFNLMEDEQNRLMEEYEKKWSGGLLRGTPEGCRAPGCR